MAEGLANFRICYLLPYVEDSSAIEDPKAPGFFRHQKSMAAFSDKEVVADIIKKRGVVLSVEKEVPKTLLFNGISKDYRKQFLQAIAFNVRAGMSAGKALTHVIEAEVGSVRPKLDVGLNILNSGGTFHEAMKAIGFLDETSLAILESGELTGTLMDAIETAVKHQDTRAGEQKIMYGAVSWTVLDIVMSVGGILGNIFGMLPQAESSAGKMSPADAERMMSAIQTAYWTNYILLAGTVILSALIIFAVLAHLGNNMDMRRKAVAMLLKVPFFNDAMQHSAVASTTSVAHSLIKGGVPFLSAARIAQKSTMFPAVNDYWRIAHDRVQSGEPISRALAQSILQSSERLIVVAHASREQLAHAFLLIASRRAELAASAAKKFSIASFMASLFYSSIAVIVTLWVTYLQYQSMMSATTNVGG